MTKDLKDKAIDFGGKDYVLVADRIVYFNETYQNGRISTELLSPAESQTYIIKATVTPDIEKPDIYFTGHSQATLGGVGANRTAALENAETSAVGRALAMMGIGVLESVASADEMNKSLSEPQQTTEPGSNITRVPVNADGPSYPASATGNEKTYACVVCGKPAEEKQGISKKGKAYHGVFCSSGIATHTQWL